MRQFAGDEAVHRTGRHQHHQDQDADDARARFERLQGLGDHGPGAFLALGLTLPGLLLLDVYTQDCVICRRLEPMVAAVAASSGGAVRARKLDAARLAEFAARHAIRGVPTLLLFRDGRLIDLYERVPIGTKVVVRQAAAL